MVSVYYGGRRGRGYGKRGKNFMLFSLLMVGGGCPRLSTVLLMFCFWLDGEGRKVQASVRLWAGACCVDIVSSERVEGSLDRLGPVSVDGGSAVRRICGCQWIWYGY